MLLFYQLLLQFLLHYTFFLLCSLPPLFLSLLYIKITCCFPKGNAIIFIFNIYKHKLEGIVPNAISFLDEINFGRTLMHTEMTIKIKLFQNLHLHFIDWESLFKICYYWVTSENFLYVCNVFWVYFFKYILPLYCFRVLPF